MKRSILALLVVALIAGLVGGYLTNRKEGTSDEDEDRPVETPTRVSSVNGATVVKIDAETRRASGIELTSTRLVQTRPEVRAYGVVLDPARITELRNGYIAARAELEAARAKLAASKTAFSRAQALYNDERNVSLAQVQASEAAYRADEASVSAAQSRTQSVAATAEQEWGAVLARSLVEGGPLVARLTERRELLLQVTLPPDIAIAQPPSRGELETPSGARAPISLVSRAPRTDARIQGLSFFYTASPETGVLPGMNVVVYLARGETVSGVAVPESAVVWWQNHAWVYRQTAQDSFTRVRVRTDLPAPKGGYLARDLPQGSTVVARGAQLLLSEEFRAELKVVGD